MQKLIFLIILIFTSYFIFSDTIVYKSGEKIEGKIISIKDGVYSIDVDGEIIEVDKSDIESVVFKSQEIIKNDDLPEAEKKDTTEKSITVEKNKTEDNSAYNDKYNLYNKSFQQHLAIGLGFSATSTFLTGFSFALYDLSDSLFGTKFTFQSFILANSISLLFSVTGIINFAFSYSYFMKWKKYGNINLDSDLKDYYSKYITYRNISIALGVPGIFISTTSLYIMILTGLYNYQIGTLSSLPFFIIGIGLDIASIVTFIFAKYQVSKWCNAIKNKDNYSFILNYNPSMESVAIGMKFSL